jgi:hypothetical protein
VQWIAIGVFAEAQPLVAAVTDLISVGVSLADLCLAGVSASMQRLAATAEVQRLDRLGVLLQNAVEVRLPGSDGAILAAPSCVGSPSSLLSSAMAERLRGPIIDGCILLGVSAASATDAARAGRVLLRYSSRHVHVLQCPPETLQAKSP